jgi:Ulp1 family protease
MSKPSHEDKQISFLNPPQMKGKSFRYMVDWCKAAVQFDGRKSKRKYEEAINVKDRKELKVHHPDGKPTMRQTSSSNSKKSSSSSSSFISHDTVTTAESLLSLCDSPSSLRPERLDFDEFIEDEATTILANDEKDDNKPLPTIQQQHLINDTIAVVNNAHHQPSIPIISNVIVPSSLDTHTMQSLQAIWSSKSTQGNKLVHPYGNKYAITYQMMKTLNVEVKKNKVHFMLVSQYFLLLQERSNKYNLGLRYLPIDFYHRLIDNNEICYSNVAEDIKDEDIGAIKKFFIPIFKYDHLSLVVVDQEKMEIRLGDSLRNSPHIDVDHIDNWAESQICRWLMKLRVRCKLDDGFSIGSIISFPECCQEDKDGCDAGVYTILAANLITHELPVARSYSAADVNNYRLQIAASILHLKLM